jgi:hypothetical protein
MTKIRAITAAIDASRIRNVISILASADLKIRRQKQVHEVSGAAQQTNAQAKP